MIDEASGATPAGIFMLADDYLRAARLALGSPVPCPGPARLLAYHSAELFLKCYLRSSGLTIVKLRSMLHDLPEMLDEAVALGLRLPGAVRRQADRLQTTKEYVRVRYLVVDAPDQEAPAKALEFADAVREVIREALAFDEFGHPMKAPWRAALPSDYPVQLPKSACSG